MSASIFDIELVKPDEQMLLYELSESGAYFEQLVSTADELAGGHSYEWKYYSKKSGWTLKVLSGKRNLMFITPCAGYFRATFTFGDKATAAVLASQVSESVKHELLAAKRYMEGRSIQLEVGSQKQLSDALLLLKIKISS